MVDLFNISIFEYREANAGLCLLALYRNCRVLTHTQLQKLVDAYGYDRWQDGPEYMKYSYPEAIEILNKADDKRKSS